MRVPPLLSMTTGKDGLMRLTRLSWMAKPISLRWGQELDQLQRTGFATLRGC